MLSPHLTGQSSTQLGIISLYITGQSSNTTGDEVPLKQQWWRYRSHLTGGHLTRTPDDAGVAYTSRVNTQHNWWWYFSLFGSDFPCVVMNTDISVLQPSLFVTVACTLKVKKKERTEQSCFYERTVVSQQSHPLANATFLLLLLLPPSPLPPPPPLCNNYSFLAPLEAYLGYGFASQKSLFSKGSLNSYASLRRSQVVPV